MVRKMNIYDIKRKANELLVNHDKLFKVLLYIGIIQAIFSAVSTLFDGVVGGIVSLIITILTFTLSHGAIVASLKTVNNMEESIDEKEDALVGLKKIGHLFPTYFLYDFIIGIICFVVGIIGFLIIMSVSSVSIEQFLQLFTITINGITVSQAQIVNTADAFSNVFSILTLVICLIIFIAVYFSLRFGLFNYILQKYDMTGMAALKESSRLMKGNKWTLFKLELSFLGWMILSAIIAGVFTMLVEIIIPISFLASLIESILTVFVSVYLYEMKLNVCVAVFYEELDYEDKYGNMQAQDEGM
jgi:uncharacterized membrane protein